MSTTLRSLLQIVMVTTASIDCIAQATSGAGPMHEARELAAAVRLADGRVLVTGGYGVYTGDGAPILASAEIFEPNSGRFTNTGSMVSPRAGHTATLLADGRVLIGGGVDRTLNLVSFAEIFDPTTSTFAQTGELKVARSFHTATILPDGSILIAGGFGSGGRITQSEIYHPDTGVFELSRRTNIERYGHIAVALPDGRVLVAGGDVRPPGAEEAVPTAAAEIFEPSSGTFRQIAAMTQPRAFACAAALLDGRVFIAGGGSTSELFNPDTETFTAGPVTSLVRVEGATATLLPSGDVLVAGGCPDRLDCEFKEIALAGLEIFNPASMTFVDAGQLSTGRMDHNAVRLRDGRVLIVGGSTMAGVAGVISTAELFGKAVQPRRRAITP